MLARGLLLLGVAALAAGAWLSRPKFESEWRWPPLTVVVVDASASVRRTRPAADEVALSAALDAAARARDVGGDFALLAVARDVRTCLAPSSAADAFARLAAGEVGFEAGGDDGSESALVEALGAASALLAKRTERELVLVSDGASTDGDATLALARLASDGVVVRCVPLAPETRFDVELRALRTSEFVEAGAPLAVLAELRIVGDATGRSGELVVRATGSRGETTRRVPLAFDRDATSARVDLGVAEPGAIRIDAELEFAQPDAVPENDRRSAWVECGDALRVLALGDEPWLDELARLEGLDVERVERVGRVGLGDRAETTSVAARLDAADLVLACDVDLREFPATIADFVRWGGAFAYVPGEATLAGWRSKSEAGALLPLSLVDDDERGRAIVILIDASGSMAGEADRAARAAAIELARAAADDERVEVRFFTDHLGPAYALGAAEEEARRAEIQALLDARAPSGPTAIVVALDELAETRARSRDRALVFLVSDGRDEAGAEERDARRVRASLAATGAELVVCVLDPAGSTPILDALLFPGELPVHAETPSDLARVFARSSARRDVDEDGPIAALVRPAGELGVDTFEAGVVSGLPRELAPLERKLRVRSGPLAKALIVDGAGEPLLAVGRVGLGTTLATALAPDERWTRDPSAWREALASSVRALARRAHAHTSTRPRARLDARGFELENVPPEWPVELALRLEPLYSAGSPSIASAARSLSLRPADGRDGADPRRVRRVPARELGGLAAGPLAARVAARGAIVWSGTVVHEPQTEFRAVPEVWPPALPAPGRVRPEDDGEAGPHRWATAVLAAGAAAVFLGAALRLAGRR
ncbi:MAG: VWA domain-containing protein [Planctomycetes bacterium]|nr:VWA domain-containing protein [Planctomycetota bacterium]